MEIFIVTVSAKCVEKGRENKMSRPQEKCMRLDGIDELIAAQEALSFIY